MERRLLLRAVRWTVVVVLFYSGLQKLIYGYYFHGQFLAYSLWRDSYRVGLQALLSPEELLRFTSYDRGVGSGPYLVSSPLFLALSNSIYLVELSHPSLVQSATRRPAVMQQYPTSQCLTHAWQAHDETDLLAVVAVEVQVCRHRQLRPEDADVLLLRKELVQRT